MWDRLKPAHQKDGDDDRMHAGPSYGGGSSLPSRGGQGTYTYEIKGGPPTRPPREFLESQYEAAPAVQPPPRNPNRLKLRTSNFRPSPSLYSPYSPESPDHAANLASKHVHRHAAGEISPPSSPEPDRAAAAQYDAGDVSPIDEDLGMSHLAIGSRAPRGDRVASHERPPSAQNQNQNRAGTNIPMMRRARRKQSDAALREAQARDRPPVNQQQPQNAAQDGPRWDPLTGERTSDSRGQPSQVKPAEFVQGLGITSTPPQKSPTAPTTFGDRVRRIARKAGAGGGDADPAAGAFTSSRPGWRGASGRTAIVDPVRDNPQVAPLRIPEKVAPLRIPDKSSRRVISPTAVSAPEPSLVGSLLNRGQTPPVSPPPSETLAGPGPRETVRKVVPSSQLSPSAANPQFQDAPSYPSSPLSPASPASPAGNTPAAAVAALRLFRSALADINANAPSSPTSPASPLEKLSTIRRKPPASHQQQHESVSSVYSQQPDMPPPPPAHNPNANIVTSNDPWVQPPSRFSVTTYATSADGTPRDSLDDFAHNRPPVPSLPQELRVSPSVNQQESVMDRRRPKLGGAYDDKVSPSNSPVVISIKDQFMSSPYSNMSNSVSQAARDRRTAATGGVSTTSAPNPAMARARAAERPISSASTASNNMKMLPPVPPETLADEASDRVGLLNAQLQALANRRININRSIKQMTELMPTDNLMDSLDVIRKREGEKRKVEALKGELSEVQREEYELGLKLHRAYKRLDRDDNWEPTSLWVRRVTG
ncbi:hypothetical protein B0H67DRAFT_601330 [Lasiosphaeris hirsuta]|uniref:Uncharacterized protein n=1 Tax=Lasiosphaeris hirsuta TaxID=260670 RepID=A0AA40AHE8_9PEZI|nr:hypothetical protein B0H67DRAFT_601330 [Lasiosphaeris hirsuta]